MNDKSDLEAALRSSANAPARTPDRAFVDALEQKLMATSPEHSVVPMARRARRLGVATTVAIVFTVAGVAAAAGIVATQPFADDTPGPAPSTAAVASTGVAPDTTGLPEVSTTLTPAPTETTVATPAPTSTVPAVAPETTVPVTVAPTLPAAPPSTSPAAATTTEVHVPATLTISCAANGASVDCSWSGAVPADGVTYAVLRGDLSGGGPGRVFFVPLGTTTWTDPMAVVGVQYSYLVHVFDASNHSLGHSNAAIINCC